MKKFICLFLALMLFISALPVQGQAAVYVQRPISGKRTVGVECREGSSESFGPQLAQGNYEKWIDRLADLPEYALEFYRWLEQNANEKGALANPLLGTEKDGEYGHVVAFVDETIQVSCSQEDLDQAAYDAAVNAMYGIFDEIVAYTGAVYDAFDRDHPEVFWLSGEGLYGFYSSGYSYSYSGGVATISFDVAVMFYLRAEDFDIRAAEYRSASAVAQGIAQRDEAVRSILSQCPETGLEAQLRYLNRALTERNAYNSAVAQGYWSAAEASSWECISALLGSAGVEGPVCEGYARAFMVLCQQLGVPCVLVDGPAKDGVFDQPEDHMWNYVRLGGKWYAVDVTWNDPYDEAQPLKKLSGYECEDWLLVGADTEVAPGFTFLQSHKVENQIADDGLMYTNGPVLSIEAFMPSSATGSLSGSAYSFGDAAVELTLSLYRPGEKTPVLEQTFSGGKVNFSFEALETGSYILRASKPGHVSRDYEVSTGQSLDLELILYLLGDTNADGRVNIVDVSKLYSHTRGHGLITDEYFLRCADLTGDNRVNIADVAKAYANLVN